MMVKGILLHTLEKDYMVGQVRLISAGSRGFPKSEAYLEQRVSSVSGLEIWHWSCIEYEGEIQKGKTMTRDPKQVSLVEWYQELVDRVFLNYEPPQKNQALPRSEKPAENDPKKAHDTSSFYGMDARISLDGAA